MSYLLRGENMKYFMWKTIVNPVRNSIGALNPAGIIIKPNPAAEQLGSISNGVNRKIFSHLKWK